nr:bsp1 protein [Melanopsichium pennsylvanicum 4]
MTSTPDFDSWSIPQLQAQVKKYGFKVSRKRVTLIDQLRAVYEALGRSGIVLEPTPIQYPASLSDSALEPSTAMQVGEVNRRTTRRRLVLPEQSGAPHIVGKERKGKGKGRKSDPFIVDDLSSSSPSSVSSSSSSLASVIMDQEAKNGEQEAGDFTALLEREAASATSGSRSPATLNSPSSSSSMDIPLSASTSPHKPHRHQRSPLRSRSRSQSSDDIPLSTLNPIHAFINTADEENSEPPPNPSPALAETMTQAIKSDFSVWTRILRYEPISFDELISIATQNGLTMDTGKTKEELRAWLDTQCICFYSAQLTGSRSRH